MANDISELSAACERARGLVRQIEPDPTLLQSFALPSGLDVFLKREDLSTIRSYKWRGAYCRLTACLEEGNRGPFVTTSAGNHAQGVALVAARLNVDATIFMPRSTPRLKREAVERHGQGRATIQLVGDSFEQALTAALEFAEQTKATVLSPFDDLHVVAGQSTVGSELLEQLPQADVVFVPVGGGGLASGVSYIVKTLKPDAMVFGVEVVGQDSMACSLRYDKRVSLDNVDRFCDGTAVATPGNLTLDICRQFLNGVITVSNEQVCAAIQTMWEQSRLVPEPSGGMALAGLLEAADAGTINPARQQCVAIVSGGNTDFLTLPLIVKRAQLVQPSRRFFQFEIEERNGALIGLLDQFVDGINIVDFRYGKTGPHAAAPVLGLSAQPEQFGPFIDRLRNAGQKFEEVTEHQTTQYRIIAFRPDLTTHSYFYHIDFPDRPGALRDLMREVSSLTSICYFNFNDTGQSEGHALVGFDFSDPEDRHQLCDVLKAKQFAYKEVDIRPLLGV